MRIKLLKREACAYIMLRRKGISINNIASIVGRSTSLVHRILKRVNLTRNDLRKLPARIKLLAALRHRTFLKSKARAWELFISGDGEEPP
jgi:hypothetical protein